MFSAILKEVTGYFDKRSIVSAFFPAFAFWGVTLLLAVALGPGWGKAATWWKTNGSTGQGFVILAGFFLWLAFWSFLTLGFHSALEDAFGGKWPIRSLAEARRRHWREEWRALDARDKALEERLKAIRPVQKSVEALWKTVDARDDARRAAVQAGPAPAAPAPQVVAAAATAVVQALVEIASGRARMGEPGEDPGARYTWTDALRPRPRSPSGEPLPLPPPARPVHERLAALVEKADAAWAEYERAGAPSDAAWTARRESLARATEDLQKRIDAERAEIDEARTQLHHDMFLLFPPLPSAVRPTALGNVMEAAQERVWSRYRIDALLVWSRLQPLLPKEAADPLADSKTSLDLMLTIAASLALFGVPLSAWVAVSDTWRLAWWVPALVAAAAALLGRHATAVVTALVAAAVLFTGRGAPAWAGQVAVFVTDCAVLYLLGWTAYRAAVQSALGYGEKIQAAFDLYRWKVLEQMNLQLPSSLEEERRMWDQVCGLLGREYTPHPPGYLLYLRDEKKSRPVPAKPLPARAVAPVRPLPALQSISAADLEVVSVTHDAVPVDAAAEPKDVANRWPLVALPAGTPIARSLLMDDDPLDGHVAVGVEVAAAQVLGAAAAPGARVDVTIVPPADTGLGLTAAPASVESPPAAPAFFPDLRVLSVQPLEGGKYVLGLAVPVELQAELAERAAGTVLIARRR